MDGKGVVAVGERVHLVGEMRRARLMGWMSLVDVSRETEIIISCDGVRAFW